ncbi:hypothetical protein MBLNU457_5820t1 [Dothideomycetes sp. NU457]
MNDLQSTHSGQTQSQPNHITLPNNAQKGRGHRRQRSSRHVGHDGEEDKLNAMGKMYKRVLDSSVVVRYTVYVAPLALIIAVPIVVGATAARNAMLAGVPIRWFFTWVEILWCSIWVSKLVVHFLPKVFQILAGVVSSGTRKYALLIRSLELPLSLVGWSVTSLATFVPIMTQNPYNRAHDSALKQWETIVQEILGACVVATLILLIEKLIIQLISINYHRKQFNAKIRENKRNIYLIGLLYEASRTLFPMYCHEFAEEDYTIADQLNIGKLGSKLARSKRMSGSVTPFRLLQDVGRFGDKVTSAFGNVAQEITGNKGVFNPNAAHNIVIEALDRKRSTEALARRIWMSLVIEGKESLYLEDMIEVLGHEHQDEAEEAFIALDRDGNGDISLEEMTLTISEISRERKSIGNSMHDVDQAITVLDRLLMSIAFIAVIFVFIAFLNRNFVTTLATAGTTLLSLSFVFSVTAQEFLGSCIFLFVKHPFDIGDRVDINTEQFTVDHISLLFTVFRRVTGSNVNRLVQIPNIVLNTLWIENISRSKAMTEQISVYVAFDTSFEDIQLLRNELLTFVNDKDNSRDFQPDLNVDVLGTTDMSKLELRIELRHKSNWANETIRAARRSKFMCALVLALRRVPIYGPGGGGDALGSATNASYSVSIPSEVAQKNAEEAQKAKDEAKLSNVKKRDGPNISPIKLRNDDFGASLGLTKAQEKAVDDLTTRDVNYDAARDEAWNSSREDSETLGERPSMDIQDQEDIRGLLRRESTKGRRKANTSAMQRPGIPTIMEPQPPIARTDYAQQAEASLDVDSYEQHRTQAAGLGRPNLYAGPSGQSNYATPSPTPGGNSYGYASPMRESTAYVRPSEMRQMQRKPSNPYRTRSDSESLNRRPSSFEEV